MTKTQTTIMDTHRSSPLNHFYYGKILWFAINFFTELLFFNCFAKGNIVNDIFQEN